MPDAKPGSDAAARPRGRGVPIADEGPDELPALLAIGLGVAFLVIAIVWPSMMAEREARSVSGGDASATAGAEPGTEDESVDGDRTDIDLAAIRAALDTEAIAAVDVSAEGDVVTAAGQVPDEATMAVAIATIEAQPGVGAVVNEIVVVAADPGPPAEVGVEAAQRSIVLTGVVPDESTKESLGARAIEIYSEDKVDNLLEVDASVSPPALITIAGSLTDPVLYDKVINGFGDLPGVEVGGPTITLEEPGELEASLNQLDSIQFASGSDLVDEASIPTLDEAADLLRADPDRAVEIGGHTDSQGGDAANLTLSQDRADRVKAELEARGVENELVAEGFGERRLKEPNDVDDAEARQANRRIEFRVLG